MACTRISSEELKAQFCECYICFNDYDDDEHIPLLLPCLHTFCKECIKRQCNRRKLLCPVCKAEHKVPENDINIFGKDRKTCELIDFLLSKEASAKDCNVCGSPKNARYVCDSCGKNLCRRCKRTHSRRHPRHGMQPIDKTITTDSSLGSLDSLENNPEICQIDGHEQNIKKYFCIPCRELTCSNCIVESHRDHETDIASELFSKRREEMVNSITALRRKTEEFQFLLRQMPEHIAFAENERQRLIESDPHIEKELIQIINVKIDDYKLSVQEKTEKLEMFIDNSLECCLISEQSMLQPVKFLKLQGTLSQKLKEFLDNEITIIVPDSVVDSLEEEMANFKKTQKRVLQMIRNGYLLISNQMGKFISSGRIARKCNMQSRKKYDDIVTWYKAQWPISPVK